MFNNMNIWNSILWFGLFYMEGETQLIVPCDDGYIPSPLSGSCIKFYSDNLTWIGADVACKKAYSQLVRIADTGMEKFIMDLLPNYTDSYWIGLSTKTRSDYEWTLWNTKIKADYVNFEKHVHQKKNALIIKNQKHWSAVSGRERHSFICEMHPKELCEAWWTVSPHSGTCIMLGGLEDKCGWGEARQRCRNYGGDDLVIILNRAMFNFISDQFSARNLIGGIRFDYVLENKDYWVGLNDIKTEGVFQWLELPDEVTFTAWDSGQPDNRTRGCGLMNYRARPYWHDYNCTRRARWVCEKYSDCKNEKWGMICPKNCTQTNCKEEFDNPGNKSNSCNVRTGHCFYGCEDGYRGTYCDIHDCKNKKWVQICPKNCTQTNCKGEFDNPGNKSTSCNRTTGHCFYGCEDGYRGTYCDIRVINIDFMKIWLSGSILAMIIFPIVCCIALCVEHPRCKKEEVQPKDEISDGFKEALQSDTVLGGLDVDSHVGKFPVASETVSTRLNEAPQPDTVPGDLDFHSYVEKFPVASEAVSRAREHEPGGTKESRKEGSEKGSGKGSNNGSERETGKA